MKNVKRLLILTMAMVMMFSITCFADLLVRYGKSSLRPGDKTSTAKYTLQSDVKEFYANQYVEVANTTIEKFIVYRYDGIFQISKNIAQKTYTIAKNQNNIYTRIPLNSGVTYVPKYTNVGLVMKNAGQSSFDIKSGGFYKYR